MIGAAPYRPDSAEGLGRGALLAVVAHLVLVLGLALSVKWKTHAPEVLEAEVWSQIPTAAAPAQPPPPAAAPQPSPTPPQQAAEPEPQEAPAAEIAREPQRKKEVKKPLKEPPPEPPKDKPAKAKKAPEPKETFITTPPAIKKPAKTTAASPSAAAPSNAEREAQRKANLQRMMNELGSLGAAPKSSGASATYLGRLRARIVPNIVFTEPVSGNPTTFVEIRCAPDGRILSRRLLDSSGNTSWDNAVLRAIDRTESLPLDENGKLPHTLFEIGISPGDR